jgi:hypothetical protein
VADQSAMVAYWLILEFFARAAVLRRVAKKRESCMMK